MVVRELVRERERLLAEMEALPGSAEAELPQRPDGPFESYSATSRCDEAVTTVTFDYFPEHSAIASLRIAHGCSEHDELVSWRPSDVISVDQDRSFALTGSGGFSIRAQIASDGANSRVTGDLGSPDVTIRCGQRTYPVCRNFTAHPVSPSP